MSIFLSGVLFTAGAILAIIGIGCGLRLLAFFIRGIQMGWGTIFLLALWSSIGITAGVWLTSSHFSAIWGA